ncbi:MAG: hypothetical protein U0V73_10300 [Acidimicrobiia bacterium]
MADTFGTPEPPVWQDRLERFREWRLSVGDELRHLPETLAQLRTGVVNFNAVSERMTAEAVATELERLPQTLTQLREGVANFNAVGERLSVATEAIERMARHWEATGFADMARRVDDAVGVVTRQMQTARETAPVSFELVQASINELAHTVGRLGELVRPPAKKATAAKTAPKAGKATKGAKKPAPGSRRAGGATR